MATPNHSPGTSTRSSISLVSENSERTSVELNRGPIRSFMDENPRSPVQSPRELTIRPSHERPLQISTPNDALLRPSIEADIIDMDVTGRGRSGTTSSSRKITIAYGPVEGDHTSDTGRNLLKKSNHAVTPVEKDEEETAINHTDRLWAPWSLRLWNLIALITFFILAIVTLEILSFYSNQHDGFSKQSQSKRYLWTYGPCAIFFLVAAVWHQVKYWTQQLMPWRTMAGGPAAASHSLLLDYVSPWSIVSFFQSLRIGHLGITLALLGSFFIKVVIIASAGLLSIHTIVITQENAPLRSLNMFGGNIDLSKIDAGDAWLGLSNGSVMVWPEFQSLPTNNGESNNKTIQL